MQLKNQRSGSKTVCDFFYYFNFEMNYDVLESKSSWILFNKNIDFNKNETESKMENPIHRFRQKNLLLQLISQSQIRSKTVMSWTPQKKKREFFVPFILSEENFLTFVFYLGL